MIPENASAHNLDSCRAGTSDLSNRCNERRPPSATSKVDRGQLSKCIKGQFPHLEKERKTGLELECVQPMKVRLADVIQCPADSRLNREAWRGRSLMEIRFCAGSMSAWCIVSQLVQPARGVERLERTQGRLSHEETW